MERTTDYEMVDGGAIREDWTDRQVPVPPQWVRELSGIPLRYRHAVLADATAAEYDPGLLETAKQYVTRWPLSRHYGTCAVFAGTSGTGKTHAAAAIANEILRLAGHTQALTLLWLPVSWKLAELFDHRYFNRSDEYGAMRRRILGCDLLVVDDLLYAAQSAPVKEFLFGVYDHRDQQQKPVITTMNAALTPEDWSAVDTVFNIAFRRRLQKRAEGFTLVL